MNKEDLKKEIIEMLKGNYKNDLGCVVALKDLWTRLGYDEKELKT